MTGRLFIFGLGYSGTLIAETAALAGYAVAGCGRAGPEIPEDVLDATHLLSTAPPGEAGDNVLAAHGDLIAKGRYRWAGYLSTTGVYGDHDGGWVDETTPAEPKTERARRRLKAEAEWQALGAHIFRLPGIYGPGRNVLEKLKAGTARRVEASGQLFSRIHVADLAAAVLASMARPYPGGRIYNLCDDVPAAQDAVISFAAALLHMEPPPRVPISSLSPMARSFYGESKSVRNDRMKGELGVTLKYPSFIEGLRAIAETF